MLPNLKTAVPGPKSKALAQRLRQCESRNVTFVSDSFPIFWERAEGQNVWDVDGNCFLDLTSGFGVATQGFGSDWIKKTFQSQAGQLYHGLGDVHPTELKVQLCEKLSEVTFERWSLEDKEDKKNEGSRGKVILGNSGFEAIEAALKTVHLATGKEKIIAFEGSYHGLGFGALTVTELKKFRNPFRKQLKEFASFFSYPTEEKMLPGIEKKLRTTLKSGKVGAILVEPMQGRGGEIIPAPVFLPLLRKLADEYKVLLILDEIYTGFFRTGKWFACEHTGTVPDLVCVGKALSGSYPISACIGKEEVMRAWPESDGEALHTSTFLGNPMGCALAVASIKSWQSDQKRWEQEIQVQSEYWGVMLEEVKQEVKEVKEVRKCGLLMGIELRESNGVGSMVDQALQNGILLLGGGKEGNVIALSPSVKVTEREIKWLGQQLIQIMGKG